MKKCFALALLFCSVFSAAFAQNAPILSPDRPAGIDADIPRLTINTSEIAKCDVVLISVRGMNFGEIGYILELKHLQAALGYLTGHPIDAVHADGEKKYLEFLKQNDPYMVEKPLYFPATYLTEFLKARLPETGVKYALIPFDWNRDWDESYSQTKKIVEWTEQVYTEAAKQNKPVYLLAHSWGSIVSHAALQLLVKKKSPVKIKKFITMGSPLVPSSKLMKAAIYIGLIKSHMPLYVKKPANVNYWSNLWAKKDCISNAISAADENARIDESADTFRQQLTELLRRFGPTESDVVIPEKRETSPKEIRADLNRLNSTSVWHGAYFSGVRVNVEALNTIYNNDAVRTFTLPQLEH